MIMNLLNPYRHGNVLAIPTYRGAGAGTSFTGASASVPLPTIVQQNDILIMVTESPPTFPTSAPSGWTNMNVPSGNSSSQLSVHWKRAGSSESAPTLNNPNSGTSVHAVIISVMGCTTNGDPWDVSTSNTTVGGAGTTSCSITGVTTTRDGCLIIGASTGATSTAGAAFSAWADASLLSVYERVDYSGTGTVRHIGVVSGGKSVAGASGSITYTFVNTGSDGGQFCGALVGIDYDTDAQAFITAAGLTTRAHKDAINSFVTNCKGASIWTKMKYIYPFVGGTAASHKFNLKDPQDADSSFRLTFGSANTHSSNGVAANSSSAVAGVANIQTHFVPSSQYSDKSVAFGVLNHTSPDINNATGGNFYGSNSGGSTAFPRFTRGANAAEWICGMGGNSRTISSITLTQFLSVSNEISGNTAQPYVDGVASGLTISTSTGTLPTQEHYLIRYNTSGTVQGTCNFTIKFAFASTGLTAAEMLILSNAVYQLQTDLSR